jgi:hypothetical protein
LNDLCEQFRDQYDVIKNNAIEQFCRDISKSTEGDDEHPMSQIVWYLCHHKELHVRRIKVSPAKQRSKLEVGTKPDDVYNCVTLDEHIFGKNPNNDTRWMIFHPLASDFNDDAIDAKEATMDHRIALAADELQHRHDDTYTVDPPFGFVVSTEWSSLISFIHNIVYFQQYVECYLSEKLREFVHTPAELARINLAPETTFEELTAHLQQMPWDTVWEQLVSPAYCNKTITQYSSSQSKPLFVYSICRLRDLLRHIIIFESQHK